jgi:hypothetical protein
MVVDHLWMVFCGQLTSPFYHARDNQTNDDKNDHEIKKWDGLSTLPPAARSG